MPPCVSLRMKRVGAKSHFAPHKVLVSSYNLLHYWMVKQPSLHPEKLSSPLTRQDILTP